MEKEINNDSATGGTGALPSHEVLIERVNHAHAVRKIENVIVVLVFRLTKTDRGFSGFCELG